MSRRGLILCLFVPLGAVSMAGAKTWHETRTMVCGLDLTPEQIREGIERLEGGS